MRRMLGDQFREEARCLKYLLNKGLRANRVSHLELDVHAPPIFWYK